MEKIKRGLCFLKDIRKYSQDHPFVKFLIVFLIFATYLVITIIKFGVGDGVIVGILTWTFFVFCTPIADAGVLVDFPVRFFTGIRMIFSEVFVWILAFSINVFAFSFSPEVYSKTIVLTLFKHIITNPFPFWIICILSALGTFLSIYFGDEILDAITIGGRRKKYELHKNKYRLILFLFIVVLIILLYYFLLTKLDINIPLF